MLVGNDLHYTVSNCGEVIGHLGSLVVCFDGDVVGEGSVVPYYVFVVGSTTVRAGVSLDSMFINQFNADGISCDLFTVIDSGLLLSMFDDRFCDVYGGW